MSTTTDEERSASEQDYRSYRRQRRQERRAARAAKKAAKPKGIDLPFRKAMHPALLAAFAVVALTGIVLTVVMLINPPATEIAIAERRSPPSKTLSHDVGQIVLAPIPEDLPVTRAPCRAVEGVVIEGGEPAHVRLGGVLQRLCPHAAGESDVARSIRALSEARLRFAVFQRSGDFSTLSSADPVRILINIRFAQRDVSAALIGPLLVHEGFHLLHPDEPLTAELEFRAREAELQACRLLIDIEAWDRGCTDAQRLVEFGRERAIQQLVAAGFPRGA
ncbi:MAG TPA: hypothetical protein VM841_07395 [Actinomycetota bacterium]|nr:hypothetical protein [Actinomycetota bacterium]